MKHVTREPCCDCALRDAVAQDRRKSTLVGNQILAPGAREREHQIATADGAVNAVCMVKVGRLDTNALASGNPHCIC